MRGQRGVVAAALLVGACFASNLQAPTTAGGPSGASRPAVTPAVTPGVTPASAPAAAAAHGVAALEERYRELAYGLDASVDPHALAVSCVDGLYAGASEDQVTELMAETAAYQASMHPDFARLAARVAVHRLHARTPESLIAALRVANAHTAEGQPAPLVSAELLAHAEAMAPRLEAALRHERDFDMDYFGLRTLQRSYLLGSKHGVPLERPQHMLMRVALCVHGADEASVLQAYDLMSRGLYTHATPTLFNAGATRQQLSSCFLLTAKDDSVAGIFETLRQVRRRRSAKGSACAPAGLAPPSRPRSAPCCSRHPPLPPPQCALISRDAGGIGLSVSHIRASNSYIRSSGGKASGLVPMLRCFDATARFVDQASARRPSEPRLASPPPLTDRRLGAVP